MASTTILLLLLCMLSLLSLSAAMWLHEWGAFDAIARFLPRSKAERILLAVVAVGFIHYGATKETNGVRGVSAPLRNAPRTLTQEEIDAGYALVRIGTNEVFDFSEPSNAVIHEKWRRRGATNDRFSIAPDASQWRFPLGTGVVERLTVTSGGDVLPYAQNVAALSLPPPYRATMGFVPEMNWGLLPPSASPSMAWWTATPSNSLVVTWRNALVGRTTNLIASVQAEYFASGDFEHRYSQGATNFTSLLYRRLDPLLDTPDGDRDGDGLSTSDELFLYGTDPGVPDTSGDGLSDGYAVAHGLDPLMRHVADGEILERVAASATNEAFASPVLATNSVAVWQMFGGFAAGWPANAATNLVWERTFNVGRTSAWQQLFVSASPASAAAWELRGAVLEWETDTGSSGSATSSPLCDSLRIPLATNDFPSAITLRVRAAAGASFVRSPTPLYLVAYAPQLRMDGGREVTGQSGATYYVFTEGADSTMRLVVDHSRRPHRAASGEDECDMATFAEMAAGGDFSFAGDATGGTLTAMRPGICELPDFSLNASLPAMLRSPRRRGGGGAAIVLDPSVGWDCLGHGCGYDGLGYDWDGDWYYEEDYYPLDSKCLRKKWYRDWGGGWHHDRCELWVRSGLGSDDVRVTTSTDGDTGKVYVDGVEVWSGTAEHVYDDWGCWSESVVEECEDCEDDCANGNCDSQEGASLGSLRFRIPLGAPVKNQVAGFVWFATDVPTNISKSTFSLLAHPDATITETDSGGTRRIACHDSRGRDLRIENIANGVRVTIYDTAEQTLEHTWEIVNAGGSASQVRLKKISRLNNVMSDETFTCSDGDWTRFDNIAGVGTQLTTCDDFADYGDGVKSEMRTTTDAAGRRLSSVAVQKSRVGDCDNAVIRETYRDEWTGTGWKWTQADYWNDPAHSGRHGKLRLAWGNARAWKYADYDEQGRETLLVEQRGDTPVPSGFPCVVSNELHNATVLANAYVTVRDFTPPSGDSGHQDDAARPRIETRYVVTNGVATMIGRTWTRYTRLNRDGHAAIKRETWRAAENSPTPNSSTPPLSTPSAYSYEVTYADTGDGTPLLMRNAVVEALDEDGILTVNTHSLSGGVLHRVSHKSHSGHPFPTYEATEADAAYGTLLRKTTRLTENDAIIADEQSIYDSQNRLRSTTYLDGTSITNAYSCCRLLWKRDREGRKVLRSAQTGTDHLYNAMEDVWLADVSTNGQYRVTQHFYDALGRETNTVVCVGTTPGEAVTPCSLTQRHGDTETRGGSNASVPPSLCASVMKTEYPSGGSDYAVHTDERGRVVVTRTDILDGCLESGEAVFTNGVEVVKTKHRSYFGGGSSMRREWGGNKFTEERRFTDYDADGKRIEYVVTESYDRGVVTNSVSAYDLLGRLVSKTVPGANGSVLTTTYTYDGTTSRILASTYTAGDVVRTNTYIYNDFGEQIGIVLDGVTNRTDVAYATDVSNIVWRVESSSVVGPSTNSLTIVRTRLTGLSAACRRHEVTLAGASAPLARTETIATFDSDTDIETETALSSVAAPVVRRSLRGVLLSTETSGAVVSNAYDALARVSATYHQIGEGEVLPLQSFDYDPCGDLLAVHTYTNGDEVASETYGHDMLGNRVTTIDALGNVIYKSYDSLGNVAAEWGATYPVRYTYDSANRRTSLSTTRDGATWDTTTWTYDAATGNCLSKTYADGSTVTYTYTPDNLPLRTTYASGRWKENVYDERRQVIGTLSSDGENDTIVQCDEYGRVISESNAVASAIYALANIGTATNEAVTAEANSIAITRTLDANDRLKSLAIPAIGYSLDYSYADDGFVDSLSNSEAIVTYAYTSDRRDAGYAIAFSGGGTFVRSVTRDPYRREIVTGITNTLGGVSHGLAYGYDALSRPVSRNGDAFAYNTRGEVESAMIGGNAETHGYDFIGNSLLATFNGATNTYAANNLNQYVSILRASESPREILHDTDGNMTNDGVFTYTYDSASRLTSVSSNGILLVTNQYDCKGRRVRKITQTATHTFFYDEWDLIYEHIANTNGTVDAFQYFWGRDLSGKLQGAGGVGGLLYVKHNGTIYVPCADAMGNILRYTDTAGNVVAAYTYDAFGLTLSQSGTMSNVFRHRFSTKYYDAEHGLYYYGYRFYSPSLMRWLNRDPIEEEGGLNLYGFCGNNAVCRYDKYGQAHFEVRRLSGLPAILNYSCFAQIIGVVPATILDLGLADKLNIEILHEHLFYDDGDNIGYRDNTLFSEDSKKGYTRRDKTEYDDCIMHEAESLISPPPYSLIGFGAPKYNCQDYADALRRKYNEIKDDPKIKCKCRRKK